jgi:hypothetical protein
MAETNAEVSRVAAPQKVSASLVQRAKKSDSQALVTIFRQFIPEEERIYWTEYLGSHGWIFGRHSLGCLTNKRLAGVTIGSFGEVIYRDGYLEYINSSVIYQPSKLALYIYVFLAIVLGLGISFFVASTAVVGLGWGLFGALVLGVLMFLALGVLLVNLVVRLYYAVRKCGLVLWIKEGVSVYVFSDRKRLRQANAMHRMVTEIRDNRISSLGHLG